MCQNSYLIENGMTKQEQIKEIFTSMSAKERDTLLNELRTNKDSASPIQYDNSVKNCPYCQSNLFVKNGQRNSLQKYKCKSCYKVFTSLSGTSSYHIQKKEKFEKYKSLMLEGYLPIKKMADNVGISIQTSFDWRHKILSGLKDSDNIFDGITEMDDIWFLYSQKGRKGLKYSRKRGGSKRQGDNDFQTKLLITTDRKSNTDLSVARIGRLKKSDIERKVGGKFSANCTLVSDKHRSIGAFAKAEGVKHISFKASEHTAGGEYHVQTINNMAARLKAVVNHTLRGVSTKYLQSYANWFALTEKENPSRELETALSKNTDSWELYTNLEDIYRKFIENLSQRTYRCPVKKYYKSQLKKTGMMSKFKYI